MTSPAMLALSLLCHLQRFAHMSDRNAWQGQGKATVEEWKEPLPLFAPVRRQDEYLKEKGKNQILK